MRASIRLGLAAFAGALAGEACTHRVFECLTEDNCISRGVQGVCEDTGFCSYPDPECPSRQRYDEFAGDGLAHECVPDGDTATGSADASATSSDGGTGDTDGCVPQCIDHDGDGYGVGPSCAGVDCDDDNAAHSDRCVYVVPGGDDATADGSMAAPWGTIGAGLVGLGALGPGSSLVLLDGVYDASTTGLVHVDCREGGNAIAGTAEQPFSVRAANERAAEIVGGGVDAAVSVVGCGWWRVHGLRGRGGDLRGSEGGQSTEVARVVSSHDIVLRRLLVSHNNRIFNSDLVAVHLSTDVLVEETEAYLFHRTAFLVWESERVTFRRCYANSRGYEDLPDCGDGSDPEVPYCSSPSDGGDVGFSAYRGVVDAAFENCVVEGRTGDGFSIGNDNVGIAVRGSIVNGDIDLGVIAGASDVGTTVVGTSIEDLLVVAPRSVAVFVRSTTETSIAGATILRSAGGGVDADQSSSAPCADIPSGCSFTAERVLVQGSAGSGFDVSDQDPWSIESCNAFDNGTNYPGDEDIADDADNIRHSLSVDANIGTALDQCAVYVPAGTPMSGAAADGGDIGATILGRIEGAPTETPLWDPETGAFPCGAIVPGVNDEPSTSCAGLHTRLNVFTNGCPIPEGYASPPACE